jgi:hypothetical protein
MNHNEKLYLGTNGKYYQRHEVECAYFLATGRDLYDINMTYDAKMFDIWVYDLMGISIKAIVDIDDVQYEDLLSVNQKILTVRIYRERNNCTLRAAKELIDKLVEEMGTK